MTGLEMGHATTGTLFMRATFSGHMCKHDDSRAEAKSYLPRGREVPIGSGLGALELQNWDRHWT